MSNVDPKVINDFGDEWENYDQAQSNLKLKEAFNQYFSIFPYSVLNEDSCGFDAGCGSGRWARYIAPQVKHLHCIDPSEKALQIAMNNLVDNNNVSYECASINDTSSLENSYDFGYCLGVLHHVPDTKSALKKCVSLLKKNSPLLIYIYYRFDNKPIWFASLWKCSDLIRRIISAFPFSLKLFITKLIAIFIYWPLARLSYLLELVGIDVSDIPLSDYRNKTFYFMSTDSLDRFGTKLEKRFTKEEIYKMMKECGLTSIQFSNSTPYWVAIGYKS